MNAHEPGPIRTCVGCRRPDTVRRLQRFVLVEGHLVVDAGGHMNGRGAWLHPHVDCAREAIRRGGFSRSLHRNVPAEEVKRCLQGLLDADVGGGG